MWSVEDECGEWKRRQAAVALLLKMDPISDPIHDNSMPVTTTIIHPRHHHFKSQRSNEDGHPVWSVRVEVQICRSHGGYNGVAVTRVWI